MVQGEVGCQAGLHHVWVFVIDWVIRRTAAHVGTGTRWKMTTMLEDLDFADDLALISSTYTQIQKMIDHLNRNKKGMGLKISTTKTKLKRINTNNNSSR